MLISLSECINVYFMHLCAVFRHLYDGRSYGTTREAGT